jgi:lysophospholipase L1-like esterase
MYCCLIWIKNTSFVSANGVENSKLLFNHLIPGDHPNYPDGKEDNTHFSELGARLVAQLVLQEIKKQVPELATRIFTPVKNN